MNEAQEAIDISIKEIKNLRNNLKKGKSVQVRSPEEQSIVKATTFSWFNKHRPLVVDLIPEKLLENVDELYNNLLVAAEKQTTRKRYDSILKEMHNNLIELQSQQFKLSANNTRIGNTDSPPDFSPITSDAHMQSVLRRRWLECDICVSSSAPLASIVMMGGLLEGLLLARINQLLDKSKVFKAKSAPKDKSKTKTLPLNEWTLKNYIDVAHELSWISQTEKDLGVVLRDYRNYIHPQKEHSHGITLHPNDALILWGVSKSILLQLLSGAKQP